MTKIDQNLSAIRTYLEAAEKRKTEEKEGQMRKAQQKEADKKKRSFGLLTLLENIDQKSTGK